MVKPFADIGKRLMGIREEIGLEPKHIAKKIGCEVAAYRMYERGDRKIPTDRAKKLSEALKGITTEYIYYGTNQEKLAKQLYAAYDKADKNTKITIKTLLGIEE